MTDIFDRATEREEMDREIALRARKPEGPEATGRCLWCGDETTQGRRWCSAQCRDEWEYHQRV